MELPSNKRTGVIVFHHHQLRLAFQCELLFENLAFVLQDAIVLLFMSVEQDFDCPGPREHLRVFHGGPVDNVIRTIECPSLNDAQLVAVIVAHAVEPRRTGWVIVDVFHIDDQGIPVPPSSRISQIEIDTGKMRAVVHVDVAMAVNEFVSDLHPVRRLRNLERERNIRDARHPGLPAIRHWILISLLEVLVSLAERRRKIRNLSVRRVNDCALTGAHTVRGGVGLDVAVSGIVQHLPDATEIGLPVRCTRDRRRGRLPASGIWCGSLSAPGWCRRLTTTGSWCWRSLSTTGSWRLATLSGLCRKNRGLSRHAELTAGGQCDTSKHPGAYQTNCREDGNRDSHFNKRSSGKLFPVC